MGLHNKCGAIRDRILKAVESTGAGFAGFGKRTADHLRAGTDGLTAKDKRFRPGAFEQAMQSTGANKPQPLGGGVSATYLAAGPGGSRSVYKPSYLENFPLFAHGRVTRLRYGIPAGAGHLAARDVSAFRLDEALGFGRIPPTGLLKGPFGEGSNMQWVFSRPSHPLLASRRIGREGFLTREPTAKHGDSITSKAEVARLMRQDELDAAYRRYPRVQREQMAVLDYIMGNTDRHLGNFRTDRHGGIVAIDNSLSFPETPDSRFGIRSDFVKQFQHVELSADVLESVRSLDPEHLRAAWRDAGLSDTAVDGALARWREICENGAITGEAWPGLINASTVELDTASLPIGWFETGRPPPLGTA